MSGDEELVRIEQGWSSGTRSTKQTYFPVEVVGNEPTEGETVLGRFSKRGFFTIRVTEVSSTK